MKKITEFILKKFASHENGEFNRKKSAYIEGFVSIVINLFIAIIKTFFGIISASLALIADGIHSFSDVATSFVVIIGFKISSKPPDKDHPFGHGRFEYIATLIIAIVLFTVAVEFFQSGITRIIDPTPVKAKIFVIIVTGGTILLKEITAHFAKNIGRLINSKTIEADFWHHRSDTLSTFFVLAGVIGSMYGIFWLDGAAAIAVSLFLVWISISLTKNTVNTLMGRAPESDFLDKIKQYALKTPYVDGIHDIIVHKYGERVLISLHAEIEDKYTAMQVHDIAEELEEYIESLVKYSTVTVHADPINKNHALYSPLKKYLQEQVEELDNFKSFHDLRIIGGEKYVKAVFDIEVDCDIDKNRIKKIKNALISGIYETFQVHAKVKVEEMFKYQVR